MKDFVTKVLDVSLFAAIAALVISFWVAFGFLVSYTMITLIQLFS